MLTLHRSAASLAAAAVLLTACAAQPGSSTVSPATATTPAPTASATPSDHALFIEAERVFRAQYAALLKYGAQGGATTLPAEFDRWITGTYRSEVAELLRAYKSSGFRFLGPAPRLVVRPSPGVHLEDSVIAIAVCVDGTGSRVKDGSGRVTSGNIELHSAFFKLRGSALLMFENKIERRSACD